MFKLYIKVNMLSVIFIVLFLLTSCKSYVPVNNDINVAGESVTESKYIINTRSGKVHTYSHGIKVIENKDNIKESTENLDVILQNEKYDICHTCYAGLLINDKISKYDIGLIEKYMRLYEFSQIEPDRAEFLISIFTVGDWYVNNVYTYQGGEGTVLTIENNAKSKASKNAYNRWQNYKTSYSDKFELVNNKRILPVVYDSNKNPSNLVLYECDLFKGKYAHGDSKYTKKDKKDLFTYDKERLGSGYKNDYVVDDCSKFAAAVYYHYINNTILKNKSINEKDGLGIDLWTIGSKSFNSLNQSIVNKLVDTQKFDFINYETVYNNDGFSLIPGDLIYRKEKAHYEHIDDKKISKTDIPGHVEFYIGNNKVVGWGDISKSNFNYKKFEKNKNGLISDNVNDNNQPYVSIIRFRGK